MKYKGLILSAAFTGAVAAPIIATVASSTNAYVKNDYAITFTTQAPIKTLSLFKSSTSLNTVAGYYTSALVRGRPTGSANGGLETSLSLSDMGFSFNPVSDASVLRETDANGEPKTPGYFSDGLMSKEAYGVASKSYDLAESSAGYKNPKGELIGLSYKIRSDARFWNGDRVTAEDFAKTYLTILDQSNAVPYANVMLKSFVLHNAQNIWDYQSAGHSFKEAIAKYPIGISYADPIDEQTLATSDDGKAYFKKEYEEGHKRHNKLILTFDSDATMFLLHFSADAISTPTSIRFFDKLGIDNYGTSIDTLMGAGPYKPVYADLDYKLVANKWDGYWDAQRVISPQVVLRVIQDESSSITLFKSGDIGQVSFGTSMLPQFMGSPELRALIKPTDYADAVDYMPLYINPKRASAKYLIDADLRRAINYSINRTDYLHSRGADNSYPPEGFATQQLMQDGQGMTPSSYLYTQTDYMDKPITDTIKTIDGDEKIITRNPVVMSSKDTLKNDLKDYLHNTKLAKEYYARFKKNHPEFTSLNLRWLFGSSNTEYFLTIKQSIEETLPGINIELSPKPDSIVDVERSKGGYDLSSQVWQLDYQDSWTDYHLVASKITRSDSSDDQTASRIQENAASDSYSLLDYVVQKINEDPDYFKNQLGIEPSTVAQYLRMASVVNDKNPSDSVGKDYDSSIWTQKPTEDNDFRGYGGEFDKWGPLLGKDTSHWGDAAKTFIDKYTPTGSVKELWQNEGYRNSRVYTALEKLIRDSGLGPILKHLKNQYTATRLIGRINFANEIVYLGFVYQTSKIPPVSIPLPGEEAVG